MQQKITMLGQNLFDQSVKNDLRTYVNIQIIATGPGDDYTTGWILDYSYLKEHYKMIATDLSIQQDADLKAIHQIYFTGNLGRNGETTIFLSLRKQRKPF